MPIGSSLGLLLLVAATFACPDKDEFCIFCAGNKCLHCAAAYLSPEGQCIEPGKKVTNCATYAADGICKTCRFRYSVDKDGNCQPITLPDCFEARDANFCSFCKFNVLARNGVCSEANRCGIKNCEICKLDGGVEVCAMCRTGYVLFVEGPGRYSCINEIQTTKNCLVAYTQDPTKCAICDMNYFWKDGICTYTEKYYLDMAAGKLWLGCMLILSGFLGGLW